MIKGLFGSTTLPYALRAGLEEASATHRDIADRVAGSLTSSGTTDFSGDFAARASRRAEEADLQRDMATLADTQLRFEADAKLLQEAYARLRTAIRGDRG
jgi:flagellar basal body rod protein FlgB